MPTYSKHDIHQTSRENLLIKITNSIKYYERCSVRYKRAFGRDPNWVDHSDFNDANRKLLKCIRIRVRLDRLDRLVNRVDK